MAKYLFEGVYTAQGLKGLLKEGGSKRRDAIEQALKSLGGTLEAFYYAFGETDVYGLADLPDNVNAATFDLLVNAAGGAKVKMVVLMTPEEVDQATQNPIDYRPPGQ